MDGKLTENQELFDWLKAAEEKWNNDEELTLWLKEYDARRKKQQDEYVAPPQDPNAELSWWQKRQLAKKETNEN